MRTLLFQTLLSLLMLGQSIAVIAQDATADERKAGLVKGRLVIRSTGQPAPDVQLTIPQLKQLTNTGADGRFTFSRVPYGAYVILIGGLMANADTVRVYVHSEVADLADVPVLLNDSAAAPLSLQIPTIALEEGEAGAEDEGTRTANVSGLLSASRDPFLSTTAFIFGPYRFQPRGYSRSAQEVQINGIPMNDIETGDTYWAQWGGLNDVFRSRSNTYGLQPSEYTFGGIAGSVYFDAAASGQRKQTRITCSQTDRSYRSRIVLTKSSGIMRSGWAYSLSVSKRWAKEGYVPGTFYDGYSYYAGLSKRLNAGRHQFNLITFGAPARRGKAAPVTQETVDISGDRFYNPAWGYQSGVKRNARIADNFQPVTILTYEYHPSNTLRWETSIGYQSGKTKSSNLDYFNGNNPRPDYYRYMPGYLLLNNQNPADARFYKEQQIGWDDLYAANRINHDSVKDADGIAGNTVHGLRSIYVQYNDVDAIHKYTFNSNFEKVLNEHMTLAAGVQIISQRRESYREMANLLGGEFYVNLNPFADGHNAGIPGYNQYEINTPNRIVREGDKYNYDYISRFAQSRLLAQLSANYNKLDFFAAVRAGYNDFSREGLYKNGLFPDVSFGNSAVQRFTTYSIKGGATYKLDGRNYFFLNAAYSQDAPAMENTFISPRTRNLTVAAPEAGKTISAEGGYLMRTPKYNLRAVGYATDIKNATEIRRYYSDQGSSFINYVMQGINTRNIGVEAAAEVKISPSLSVTGVAAVGQAFYTANPASAGIYSDNDTVREPLQRSVYIKNYYLAAGPQSAYTLGFSYRSKSYWYGSINCSYLDRNYVDISPDQRTAEAVAGVPAGSAQYGAILDQEVLPAAFTVDLFGGKSFLLTKYFRALPRGTFLYLNAGISNLLDADLRTGGFEQLRYDFANSNPDKFDTKYFYGSGRNFFINLSLKF